MSGARAGRQACSSQPPSRPALAPDGPHNMPPYFTTQAQPCRVKCMSHQCHSLARVQCSRLNSLTAATICFSDVTRQLTFPEVDASQGGHLCHWSSKASWVCGQTSTFPGSTACLVCRWTPPPAGLQYWQVGHYGVYGPLPIAVDSSSMTWEMPSPQAAWPSAIASMLPTAAQVPLAVLSALSAGCARASRSGSGKLLIDCTR